jgi:rhomboid family GlyGly-CTERM serine protease
MHTIAIRSPPPLQPMPMVVGALVVAAVLAWLMPGAALGWEPGATPWRLLTSQLAHWDGDHLLWDALAVLVLGCWAERRWPGRTRLGLAIALPLIPLAVVLVYPDMAFRGLSGLACTLATVAAIGTWQEGRRDGDTVATLVALGLLALLLGKTAYETLTGDTVFAAAVGWSPVPLAHAVGALAGWLACAVCHPLTRGVEPCPGS